METTIYLKLVASRGSVFAIASNGAKLACIYSHAHIRVSHALIHSLSLKKFTSCFVNILTEPSVGLPDIDFPQVLHMEAW